MPSPEGLENAAQRREKIMLAVHVSVSDNGYPPTLRELADTLGVSRRQIAKDVNRLARDGLITHSPGLARSLRIL